LVEVGAGELPLERGGDLFVAAEREELLLECVEVGEVARGEHFALDDREVDFGLVEPAGVDGVWTRIGLLCRPFRRLIEALPRCAEPLSTITNTRWALL